MAVLLSDSTTYALDLNDEELLKANSFLLKMGITFAKIVNLPEDLIEKIHFSDLVTDEASKLYEATIPNTIKTALRRSDIDDKIAWNFLIITEAGISLSSVFIKTNLFQYDS